jgi:hypothetical protein
MKILYYFLEFYIYSEYAIYEFIRLNNNNKIKKIMFFIYINNQYLLLIMSHLI